MKQRAFFFAPGRCFGCGGCIAACAAANGTGAAVLWRDLLKLPPAEGDHRTLYLSLACNHCVTAPCVTACPSGALIKRKKDGVVIHRESLCLGCRYCQMACPYDAIRWDEQQRVVSKCNFCYQRLDRGGEPACVETCFGGALSQKILDTDREDHAKEAPGFTHLEEARPAIRFLPPGPEGGAADG